MMADIEVLVNDDVSSTQFLENCEKIVSAEGKNKKESINLIVEAKLLSKFTNFLDNLYLVNDEKKFNDFAPVIKAIMEISTFVLESSPDVWNRKDFRSLLTIMKKSIAMAVEKKKVNRTNMILDYDELETLFQETTKAKKSKISNNKRSKNSANKPPVDFRNTIMMPTSVEVNQSDRNGDISPALIKGPYENVEHYLRTQFCLLREDYVHAIRTGLSNYLNIMMTAEETQNSSKHLYETIRVYSEVHFQKCKLGDARHIVYMVNFDPKGTMVEVDYETDKIFLPGSSLLFSRNDFQTFFCATIHQRDIQMLTSGKLYVTVEENGDFDEELLFLPDITFTMVESDAFWEPYSSVMKVLRNYSEESFPMRPYIIEACTEVKPPAYLSNFRKFDIFGHKVDPLDVDKWPDHEKIGLEEHQYTALKMALTKEFCVIQGPPGTGKTFLGLRIVEVLLRNMVHQYFIRKPILILSFTNHALDQFLEGILRFTGKVIRVGGQCRSELLNSYNLKTIKILKRKANKEKRMEEMELRRGRKKGYYYHDAEQRFGRKRGQAMDLLFRIDKLNDNLALLEKPIGIFSFACLEKVMQEKEKDVLSSDFSLVMWLLDEKESYFPPDHKVNDSNCVEQMKDITIDRDDLVREVSSDDEWDEELDMHKHKKRRYGVKEEDITYSISLSELREACVEGKNDLDNIVDEKSIDYTWAQRHLTTLVHRYFILEEYLQKTPENEMQLKKKSRHDLLELPLDHRWNTYFHWIEAKKRAIKQRIYYLKNEYSLMMVELDELALLEDIQILSSAYIVGMTTTRAARNFKVLEKLKPSIVIVEEAAHVLEAHIVASLNKFTEHVILLGDHLQLKPPTAVHDLSQTYNLDCSLFERVINNGMDCPTLTVQRRMRPEISSLISPSIYKNLVNHESVRKYESIKGVSKNVFFVDHTYSESEVEDSTSYINEHEAKFVVELCRYLVNQGYDPENITMLTTYGAQKDLIKQDRVGKIERVRTCVVDDYQGEENDIVILSLVRSNDVNNLGFLKIPNRVCVALSRAKKGFYLVGNMSFLSSGSTLWKKIQKKLTQNKGLGPKLLLRCQKHGTGTEVASAEDFNAVKGGGCHLKCKDVLPCGHKCTHACHVADTAHEDEFACPVEITRTLDECGHTVTMACGMKKYRCTEKVEFKSETCEHILTRECGDSSDLLYSEEIVCQNYCKKILPCQHECPQICHPDGDDHRTYVCQEICNKENKLCEKNHVCLRKCHPEECGECLEVVNVSLPCGHTLDIPCSKDPKDAKCPEPCNKPCSLCDKPCQKECWENCEPCMTEVSKIIPDCGHLTNVPCSVEPSPEMCQELTTVPKRAACGHDAIYGVLCKISKTDLNAEEYLQNCEVSCGFELDCGHECLGSCGQCMQGRLHIGCKKMCGVDLICGHKCVYGCENVCQPCYEYTLLGCSHATTKRRCGAIYVKCPKQCTSKCEHQACTRSCGDLCNRDPCNETCSLKLECGHPCLGFCGEPCPPICRTCDVDANISEDVRYIVLEDCKCIFESQEFEDHLDRVNSFKEMYRCLKCDELVVSTRRYMNRIKKKYQDIVSIYQKVYDQGPELTTIRNQCMRKLVETYAFADKIFPGISELKKKFLSAICDRRDMLNKQDVAVMKYFSLMFNTLDCRLKKEEAGPAISDDLHKGIQYTEEILGKVTLKVLLRNKNVMHGLRNELIRAHRVLDYCTLMQYTAPTKLKKDSRVDEINKELKILIHKPNVFSEEDDRQFDDLMKEFLKILPNNGRYSFHIEALSKIKYMDFLSGVSVYRRAFYNNNTIQN